MSRYFNSFMDDYSEALEHSWGTSPRAKAREKEYNHWYYQKHKDKIEDIRKRSHDATNKYKQAQKSHDEALIYKSYSDAADSMLYASSGYPGILNGLDANSLENDKRKYERLAKVSETKSRELNYLANRQKAWAKGDAEKILQRMKNPTAKDLVEFYLDTTVAKVKKSVNKAKKYATKAMSTAEKEARKYATKAMSTAEKAAKKAKKYATKGMSTAEKYATKTIKSAANKAKKYVKE